MLISLSKQPRCLRTRRAINTPQVTLGVVFISSKWLQTKTEQQANILNQLSKTVRLKSFTRLPFCPVICYQWSNAPSQHFTTLLLKINMYLFLYRIWVFSLLLLSNVKFFFYILRSQMWFEIVIAQNHTITSYKLPLGNWARSTSAKLLGLLVGIGGKNSH